MLLTKLIVNQAILLLFQVIVYFGCEKFQHNMHNVEIKADRIVPFMPWTSLFYCLWFPLIALFPIRLYYASPEYYVVYMRAMVAEIIISVICYLVYPTTFERPTPPDTFWGNIMKIIYKGSYKGVNCAPSLHCSSCYLIISIVLMCTSLPGSIRGLAGVVAALIVISTMTTKQHTIIDVVSALPVVVAGLLIGFRI